MKNISTLPLILPALLLCFFLSSCTGNKKNHGITPMPSRSQDLSDSLLFEAIEKFLSVRGAPPNSEYDFARADLNGDGKREGLVLFKLPHTYWCGWDGCGMAIFKANSKSFTPLSTISNLRGPIHISSTGNHGWRDIIIRVSGTNIRDKNVLMTFDGQRYPQSPMLAREMSFPLTSVRTEQFFR